MDSSKIAASFKWLNLTQFLGALNDNVLKLLVVFFLSAQATQGHAGGATDTKIVALAQFLFVLPFLLFSHAGGVLADRYSKRHIIVVLKYVELVLMCFSIVAVWLGNAVLLYSLLFLMCAQSAFFGPSKYGIVPELVPTERLSKANGFLSCLTYLAIIMGTFVPSLFLLFLFEQNFYALSLFIVVLAVAGVLTSHRIVRTPAAGKRNRFSLLFVVDIFKTLRSISPNRYLLLALLGDAYFLFLGGFLAQNLLLYGRDYLHMGGAEGTGLQKSGFLFPLAALGIGLGAVTAGKLSGRNIEIGIVPIGAIGLTAACLLLGSPVLGLWGALAAILLAGFSAGLYEVPLSAYIQYASPADRRGEILACMNFLCFLGVAISAGLVYFLMNVLGLTSVQGFLVMGLLTLVLAVGTLIVVPDFFVRFIGVIMTRVFYRLTVRGIENVPVEGGALLVSNHVTWVDALLIMATQQRRIRFVMAREIYHHKWFRPVFRLMGVIPISPTDPPRQIIQSLREARQALDDGYLVCIFAEGAITRNGNMREFKPGLERIVRDTPHPIIPVYIGGAWGSIFSYCRGKLLAGLPRRVPYPITVLFGTALPSSSSSDEIRQKILELSTLSFEMKKHRSRCLPVMLVRSARRNWFRPALGDSSGKKLSFGRTLTGAVALSREIERMAPDQKMIGILLPASVGGALTNLAVSLLGKVAVNLNFTVSAQALQSAIRQCEIRTIISSRAFMHKLEGFKAPDGVVMLEDVLCRITPAMKMRAFVSAILAPARALVSGRLPGPDDPATVIFSSGSTGDPKGIMLSHHNIISNIESFRTILHLTAEDRMCAVLPLFHSFGYTTTLWCPFMTGFQAFYHPNPLDGAKIAEMVREQGLTILLATPTFLLAYIRRAKAEDFRSLRLVVVGAEKLKKQIADAFQERFGVRPLEGYGATELSPVGAVNVPDVSVDGVSQAGTKEGSIGHPLPGIAMKVVDPDRRTSLPPGQEGVLLVKGPNVMMGYLNNPAKTSEVLRDGWYETGDVARIDSEGFVFLLDRMSRYSKIGGEMVPHVAIEEKFYEALKTMNQAVWVTSAPDEKKGEQLVVFYTDEAGNVDGLFEIAKNSDLPNLWKPKKENFVRIEVMPTLGSGKLDMKRLREMAREYVENRPTLIHRVVEKIREKLHEQGEQDEKA